MNRAQDGSFTVHIFNLPAAQCVNEEMSQHLWAIFFSCLHWERQDGSQVFKKR